MVVKQKIVYTTHLFMAKLGMLYYSHIALTTLLVLPHFDRAIIWKNQSLVWNGLWVTLGSNMGVLWE